MTGDSLYRFLRVALDVTVWGGELVGDLAIPPREPAVFVANHAGALGPIGAIASLPMRLHPWIVGDMVDDQKAAAYLMQDFVMPELQVPRALAAPFAAALARLTVPLLRTVGCVPVWHDRDRLETHRISDAYLAAGRSLLIFPEDPDLPVDPVTSLRPFKTGFAHLGSLHYARTGRSLNFIPVAVHRRRRRVQLGSPIRCNAHASEQQERRRVTHVLERIIAGMLAEANHHMQIRLSESR